MRVEGVHQGGLAFCLGLLSEFSVIPFGKLWVLTIGLGAALVVIWLGWFVVWSSGMRWGSFSWFSWGTSSSESNRLHAVVGTTDVVPSWCIAGWMWQGFGLIVCQYPQAPHDWEGWECPFLAVIEFYCIYPGHNISQVPWYRISSLISGCCCIHPWWWWQLRGRLVGWKQDPRWSQFWGSDSHHGFLLGHWRNSTMRWWLHLGILGYLHSSVVCSQSCGVFVLMSMEIG